MKLKIATILILALVFCSPSMSQGRSGKKVTLTGIIVNRDTLPISNVMIFVDGQNSDITTNSDGEFRLRIKPDVSKLTFYTPGDGVFEIEYVGQMRLEIMLNREVTVLNTGEAEEKDVVELGYGRAGKDDIVGSVSTIKKDKSDRRAYRDIYDMIVGEVPGVFVNGGRIMIRGEGSLNSSNEPMLVVDGSQVQSVGDISPDDVDSISILKGSSAAIYGTRGANGVIIIKTKRGTYKK